MVEFQKGIQLENGFISPYFATDRDRKELEMKQPYVLVHNSTIHHIQELVTVLDFIKRKGRPLFIYCEEVGSEALASLVVNHLQNQIQINVCKAPIIYKHEIIEDVAAFTGAQVFDAFLGERLEMLDPAQILG